MVICTIIDGLEEITFPKSVCVCVRECVRACVRACVRVCVRACVCACVRVHMRRPIT